MNNKMSRIIKKAKLTTLAMLYVLTAGALQGCSNGTAKVTATSTGSGNEPFKIRLGVDADLFSVQFRVAEAKGIFDKYNIDAEISTFTYGIDTLNALVLDQVDSGEAMDFAAATRLGGNSNLKIAAFITSPTVDSSDLYVVGDDINSPSDLTGKNIAVQKGTVNEYIWAQVFDQYGVDPASVNQLYFSSNAEMVAAFNSGYVDTMWAGKNLQSKVLAIPNTKSLGNYGLINFRMRGYLMLKEEYIKANEKGIERLLKALGEASEFINDNREEAAEIVYNDLKIPKEDLITSFGSYEYDVRFTQEDFDHINKVAVWSMDNNLIANTYSMKDFLYLDPIKKAFPDKVTYKE